MKALNKRINKIMELVENPDGSFNATDADGSTFKISESTKKRWFKVLPEKTVPEIRAEETEEVLTVPTEDNGGASKVAESIPMGLEASSGPIVIEAGQNVLLSDPKPISSILDSVKFLSDTITSKPGMKTTFWQMKIAFTDAMTLVIQDACTTKFPRGPVAAWFETSGQLKISKTVSAKRTILKTYPTAGREILQVVKKIRREYFQSQKSVVDVRKII
jgi:hypothetical protein